MIDLSSPGMDGVSGRAVERAVDELRAGALLAYPTETLFGLGADGRCAGAVERLRRPS